MALNVEFCVCVGFLQVLLLPPTVHRPAVLLANFKLLVGVIVGANGGYFFSLRQDYYKLETCPGWVSVSHLLSSGIRSKTLQHSEG